MWNQTKNQNCLKKKTQQKDRIFNIENVIRSLISKMNLWCFFPFMLPMQQWLEFFNHNFQNKNKMNAICQNPFKIQNPKLNFSSKSIFFAYSQKDFNSGIPNFSLWLRSKENQKNPSNSLKSLNLQQQSSTFNQNTRFSESSKQQVVSITYEEIGLFPRSFNRVFDRFFKQLFFDVEDLVIQEYRFYRYLFLTTVKCLFILLFVPLGVNFLAKNYFIRPITEYYWNTQNHEIFLNSYQQKRAFTEFKSFEEKIYFESFLFSENPIWFESSEKIQFHSINNQINFQEINDLPLPEFKVEGALSSQKKGLNNSQNLKDDSFLLPVHCTSCSKGERGLLRSEAEAFVETQTFPLTMQTKSEQEYDSNKTFLHLQNQSKWKGLSPKFKLVSSQMVQNFAKNGQTEMQKILPNETEDRKKFINENQNKINFEEDSKNFFQNSFQKRLQMKIFELANHYNEESIEAVTNFFADILSFISLCFLLVRLEIQINITKSFLLEVFFGLDDSKKSLLILFLTDLLVGYHSPNIWELFFQTLFDHYGLPESQTTIFLLVATLPVLLDVLFKYLIFRHLNRASPATVATYHAMIE